ncbi:N-methyl-L-tryptophan oxidase [Arthrobacter globiformis]|uniref:N-methyl-L-tryptophan oxidase n=1 Tax=Arthrobacter globiformis TaxID=1665 RepID=UPI00278502B7|nr:N-methyl-L-tryptophan oxidase [Arthrobacter globiformis]MDQ0864545.1 sarcosine oxidase [Arthrobacter globiformis]
MTYTKTVDVAVIGAGSIGSMTLWQLSKRAGVSVLGIEQFGPAHSHAAFSGESRLFRAANKEGAVYTDAALRARELWTQLELESGRELLLKTGVLAIAPAGHAFLESTLRSIGEKNLPHRILDAAALRREYQQFRVDDGDMGVMDLLGGGLRPELSVATAQRRAIAQGAEILYGTEVLAIKEDSDGVLVSTSAGPVRAGKVVVTSGAWTAVVLPELHDLVKAITYPLTWFMPEDISQFTREKFPCWMRDLDGDHAFGVPTLDGYSIKIAPIVDLPLMDNPADKVTELTRDQLAWCTRIATAMLPGLVPEPVRWSTHPESITADHVPILDVSESGRVVIGGGFSGNGFKFAPAYGRLLADLVETGSSDLQHPLFTLDHHRRRAHARANGLPVEGGDAVLIGH